jgi:hypothetical protein
MYFTCLVRMVTCSVPSENFMVQETCFKLIVFTIGILELFGHVSVYVFRGYSCVLQFS